jgi:hypothetical protein
LYTLVTSIFTRAGIIQTHETHKLTPTRVVLDAPEFRPAHLSDPDDLDDPFGACPERGKSDGYRNIYRRHSFCCAEHRLTWCPGSNLMSSWRDEGEEDWRQGWEHLKGYGTVDGFGEYAPGATLGEQTNLEALLPDH